MIDSVPSEERFSALADDFVERHRLGQKPSVEGYAAAHPDLAAEIRRAFPALIMMEQFKPGSGDVTGGIEVAAVVVRGTRLERLGDFRVLREAGRGGMGVVYEAEQESLGRRVALKVLAAHAIPDSAQVRRFEREARAAAQLHHTNIVPVFGVGEQDGLHYYAMQFIQGLGLDAVIEEVKRLRSATPTAATAVASPPDFREGPGGVVPTATGIARSLVTEQFAPALSVAIDPTATETAEPACPSAPAATPRVLIASPDPSSEAVLGPSGLSSVSGSDARYWRSVARVGLQVARALEYAHTQGIFHRDIKPSNILLDAQGTAWVADFGLAKAVEGDNLTHTGDIVGTIRYMAPERFHGRCDGRSDVYALGLTLYEMLALRPAFDQAARQALIRQVMEEEPPRLRKLDPSLPRDLETVVQKAIAREPVGRYQAAAALAEDLSRFLDDKPVRARVIGAPERCWKWARRRPAIAALLAGLAAAVLTGLSAVTWQWRAAVGARDEARNARDEARDNLKSAGEAVDTFFTTVSEEYLLNEPGMQPLRRKLLKLALPYYQAYASRRSEDPAHQIALARAYLNWGTITSEIGSRSESKKILQTAVIRFEKLLDSDPENLDVRKGLARSNQDLAYSQVFTNETKEGGQSARRAAAVWSGVVRDRPDDPEWRQMLGRSYDLAAIGYYFSGDLSGAESEFKRAIAILTAGADRFPDHSETRRRLARTLSNFAEIHLLHDDLDAAVETNTRALRLLEALLAERPTSARLRKDMAAVLGGLGKYRLVLGYLHPAEADLEQCRRVIDEIVQANSEVIEYRDTQAETYLYIGLLQAKRGQTEQAKANLRKVISMEKDLLRLNPKLSNSLSSLAESTAYLAGVERETGRFDLATKNCDECVGITVGPPRMTNPNVDRLILLGAIESASLSARMGESLATRKTALNALLREWENKTPGVPLDGEALWLAVEGYLALAEIAGRSGSATDILGALGKAEASLAVAIRANPGRPRWKSLHVRIETARGFALAEARKAVEAKTVAEQVVVIAKELANDTSYSYDLACVLALQSQLDPSAYGPPAAAVAALRGAVEIGFDNVYKLKNDARLAPIRSREDFQTLVHDMEKKSAARVDIHKK